MFSGKSDRDPSGMAPASLSPRHKCIVLQQWHTNDRISQTTAPKAGELCTQWCVLPVLNALAAKSPESMWNCPVRCKKEAQNNYDISF